MSEIDEDALLNEGGANLDVEMDDATEEELLRLHEEEPTKDDSPQGDVVATNDDEEMEEDGRATSPVSSLESQDGPYGVSEPTNSIVIPRKERVNEAPKKSPSVEEEDEEEDEEEAGEEGEDEAGEEAEDEDGEEGEDEAEDEAGEEGKDDAEEEGEDETGDEAEEEVEVEVEEEAGSPPESGLAQSGRDRSSSMEDEATEMDEADDEGASKKSGSNEDNEGEKEEKDKDDRPSSSRRMTTRSITTRSSTGPARKTARSIYMEVEADDGGDDDDDDGEEREITTYQMLIGKEEACIRTGSKYQADIPEMSSSSPEDDAEKDSMLWSPPKEEMNEKGLMDFCEEAVGIYMLTFDRALYILMNAGYDFTKALDTVSCRRPFTDEWCDADKQIFRNSYALFDKDFNKFRQVMPHRSMQSIIQHYYNTKKFQNYKGLNKARAIVMEPNRNINLDPKIEGDEVYPETNLCDHCHEKVDIRYGGPDNQMNCKTCLIYYRLMNKKRPIKKNEHTVSIGRLSEKRMRLEVVEDYAKMCDDSNEPSAARLDKEGPSTSEVAEGGNPFPSLHTHSKSALQAKDTKLQKELSRYITRINLKHHAIEKQKRDINEGLSEKVRSLAAKDKDQRAAAKEKRASFVWSDNEKITAFHCFLRYGRDFDAVSEVVGTKTRDHVRNYYQSLQPNIDQLLDDRQEQERAEVEMMEKEDIDTLINRKQPTPECVEID